MRVEESLREVVCLCSDFEFVELIWLAVDHLEIYGHVLDGLVVVKFENQVVSLVRLDVTVVADPVVELVNSFGFSQPNRVAEPNLFGGGFSLGLLG